MVRNEFESWMNSDQLARLRRWQHTFGELYHSLAPREVDEVRVPIWSHSGPAAVVSGAHWPHWETVLRANNHRELCAALHRLDVWAAGYVARGDVQVGCLRDDWSWCGLRTALDRLWVEYQEIVNG